MTLTRFYTAGEGRGCSLLGTGIWKLLALPGDHVQPWRRSLAVLKHLECHWEVASVPTGLCDPGWDSSGAATGMSQHILVL